LSRSPPRELRLRPALFLDRDGVLNEEVGHLHDPRDLRIIPGAESLLRACNRGGVAVVVVTNQAGIGRGLYDTEACARVNRAIAEALARSGAIVDGWYLCPHRPDDDCACRKPRPGLLRTAAADLGLDLPRSVMVGDKVSDLEAAQAAGVGVSVLVRTGHGREEEQRLIEAGRTGLFRVCHDSLADAERAILGLLGLGLLGLGRAPAAQGDPVP
jgi:D-glycero-D-manno-heptose 1,7-bisphosphate phosphatase